VLSFINIFSLLALKLKLPPHGVGKPSPPCDQEPVACFFLVKKTVTALRLPVFVFG